MKVFLTTVLLAITCIALGQPNAQQQNAVIKDFLNLRFGMFIHYNMSTYFNGEQWAYPFHDPQAFAPTHLDCRQWAKAAKSAGMKYAVLTTKHHDGFCLWNTSVTGYDIANSAYKQDIVKQYAEAFRAEGLKVGFYFSVWDRHHNIDPGNITPENIAYTKKQLTELLTNYGDILCIVIDGWGSKWAGPSFEELPFNVLADHIHSIQPNCLVINHSCRTDLDVTQVVHYEATHGQHCPYDNTIPSQQGPTIQPAWFWEPEFAHGPLKSTESILEELRFANNHYSNYLLNAAPNKDGRMDDNVVARLAEVGAKIQLPDDLQELPPIHKVHQNVKVKASSYSNKDFKPENVIDANLFTRWQFAEGDSEKWIELDFGKRETFNTVVCGELDENVKSFKIEALVKGKWKEIARGGKMTCNFKASFQDVTAQKFRLTVLEYEKRPLIAEITFVRY